MPRFTTPKQTNGKALTETFDGQTILRLAGLPATVSGKVQRLIRVHASVAVHVTEVTPTLKTTPLRLLPEPVVAPLKL